MKLSLLVVDDDRGMVRTLCDLLRLQRWEVRGAASAEEALERAREHRFDAVLMDVRMAGMSGIEALRLLRELRPGVPVLLMTAYAARGLLEEARRLGAFRVLSKPFALPELVAALRAALRLEARVLVVDDDPDFLATLCAALGAGGIETWPASSLAEARSCLERHSPAVVLLDLRLDGDDPAAVVRAVKELAPASALILYSGYPDALRSASSAIPEDWFLAALSKPFPPDRLLELLHAHVGR